MLRVVHSSRGRDAVVPMMVAIVSENETGTAWLPLYTKPRIGCLCNSGFHPGAILSNRNDGVSREAAYKGNQVCSSSSFHFKAKAEALRSFFPPPMAPKSDNTEAIVLKFVNEQNKPLNSQNVADALQKFNLKKTAVQKSLDTLADSGKISFKEYGKQKIYLARQDQFEIPNSEELNQMKEASTKLQEQLAEQKRAVSEVEGEIKALQSNLTLEQIKEKDTKLRKEVKELEDKLEKLHGGVTLVKPEDRKIIEQMFSEKINQWRKRKRIFKDLWDTITENSPKDIKEFKEELGLEYDEDVGVNLQSFIDLLPHSKKRPRGQ